MKQNEDRISVFKTNDVILVLSKQKDNEWYASFNGKVSRPVMKRLCQIMDDILNDEDNSN